MRRHLTWGLALLRITGCAALLVLLWNPISSRLLPGADPPLVLLDASLSMAGHGGRWREALDSARALAGARGAIWRFGDQVTPYDSGAPSDGSSRLAPAIAAAAARGGPITVVTDGSVSDVETIAPDLLRSLRIVTLERPAFYDAFIATVEGTNRIAATDTLLLKVSYGTVGKREEGRGKGKALLVVTSEGRRLAFREVSLPDSGIVATEITLPASRFPLAGWHVLDIRLQAAPDPEPRDDGRLFLVEVNPTPSVVVLASPPDWDLRFFARTLADVARVPVTVFVETEPGTPARGHWRDAATLTAAPAGAVERAVAGARLIVEGGDPARFGRVAAAADRARLRWPTVGGLPGEWYVDPPPPSPFAAGLGGLAWDSLPPAVGVIPTSPDSTTLVVLTARLARRGAARPVVLLSERGGEGARVTRMSRRWGCTAGRFAAARARRHIAHSWPRLPIGFWGKGGGGREERVTPKALVVANGLPVVWRWTGPGAAHDLGVTLRSSAGERRDTLRFDAAGEAPLVVPPAVYHYTVDGGPERGMIAVETYSDEWRPPPAPALTPQAGVPAERFATVGMRDRWWLFALAIAAFVAEWVWRRRLGLP